MIIFLTKTLSPEKDMIIFFQQNLATRKRHDYVFEQKPYHKKKTCLHIFNKNLITRKKHDYILTKTLSP